jgi:hypothetical protein
LGSEVLLRVEILSEDNFVTTNLLWAPNYTWSARRCQSIALCRTQMWEITKDRQCYHHLPPTHQPWGTRQMKVTSTRVSIMGTDDKPISL